MIAVSPTGHAEVTAVNGALNASLARLQQSGDELLTEVYDEAALKERLSHLDKRAKTAFAAACADSLVPLQERYWSRAEESANESRARDILDSVWGAVSKDNAVVSSLASEAAAFGPSDDEPWLFDMGYAQNAAAALAYAIRTWLSDDVQEAAWAARQVCEAAEYSFGQPDMGSDELLVRKISDISAQNAGLDSSAGMQSALAFLDQALKICEATPSSWDQLQRLARSAGQSWASSFR